MRGPFNQRRRRKGAVAYSDRDRRTWRDLAGAAARVAADPVTDKTGMLEHRAARREVMMPVGHRDVASPFLALQVLGRLWTTLDLADRLTRAAELAALAARCTEILDRLEEVRAPRPRADIDS